MKLDHIVPWGRSFDEYLRMFSLTQVDLGSRILGCGDGPASFNAELTARGGSVISIDPLYACDGKAIQDRIAAVAGTVIEQVRHNEDHYVWSHIPSPDALYNVRMGAMERFLEDYPRGRRGLRYVPGALPYLPFRPGHFDLVLCSHLLFTYSGHLDEAFHYRAMRAMLAAGAEVRIFPLLALDGSLSPHLTTLCLRLNEEGFETVREGVNYEFQRGAHEMLRVSRRAGKPCIPESRRLAL